MGVSLQQLRKQLQEIWQRLQTRQKIIIGIVAVVFFVGLTVLTRWAGKPDYVPVVTNLTLEEAGQITEALDEMKVPYEVSEDETTILVPAKDKHRVRMQLATQGLMNGNNLGFALFDQTKLGTTDFERKVNYVRALQDELEMTISQLEGVKGARVHITSPEEHFFEKDRKPAKASVTLKLVPGRKLTQEQVNGIVNLVASAVEGLEPSNVVILDTNGNILSQQVLGEDFSVSGQGAMRQLEIQNAFKKELENSVQTMLEQVIGFGKVVVRVNADLNFDQKEVEKNLFEPVVDEKGIVRSVQELEEYFSGSESSGGVPGTASNTPPTYPTTSDAGGTSGERYERNTTFEINNIKEHLTVSPGSVRKLSVAVVVDGELSAQQQSAIEKTVAAAVGIDPERGDSVIVEGIPYDTSYLDEVKKDMEAESQNSVDNRRKMILIGQLAGIILAMVLFYKAVFRRKKAVLAGDGGIDLIVGDEEVLSEQAATTIEELSEKDLERQKMREQIEQLARKNPEDVAQLIRSWLAEDEE